MFAAETFGVVPDVLCVAKGLSGGYAPLSAMICRRPIADAFWGPIGENPGFVEGHTFEGNPISCAAGIAVLREILERDLLRQRPAAGRAAPRRASSGWREKYGDHRRHPRQGAASRRSSSSATATTKERFPAEIGFGVRVGRRALANGLLCRFDPNWIAFGPPWSRTAEQIDEMVAILDRSLGEVLGKFDVPCRLHRCTTLGIECPVRSWFASEDWFAVWLGAAVVLIALPTADRVSICWAGWPPRESGSTPSDAIRPVSVQYAVVCPGLSALLFTYLLLLVF